MSRRNNVSENQLIFVSSIKDLRLGEGVGVKVCVKGLGLIAVFQSEGGFYALADRCSHGEASLSEGWLEGMEIECPAHGGRFDIRTGEPLSFPVTKPVHHYSTVVMNGDLYIER
ncbi:non-heme iron oxygenase ferredoxin subunit [Haliea atlantica]